ncbi:hypothetical protein [Bradyrhizobium sp.]|uniref:hypothetical protein n=1 Tax=Bradyrhizobium sp. TaxID=376 RepID=UPI001EBE24A7|nr:hypothetical protein [Bradyrhizobium sp.]MBV9979093.1 hypothetical protein [Bradyrhizobium sp.]
MLRRFASFEDMKLESYRYWRAQPAFKRLDAVAELNADIQVLKGVPADAQRLQRTVRLLKR